MHEEIRGEETVLVCEDEALIRQLVQRALESFGYSVLPAETAEVALELDESHPGPIHLLVTDVVMPGMSGPRLALQMTDRHPELKVLFISGYPSYEVQRQEPTLGQIEFLAKPFRPLDLLQRIRSLLTKAN